MELARPNVLCNILDTNNWVGFIQGSLMDILYLLNTQLHYAKFYMLL
jgi:hypothetical protein